MRERLILASESVSFGLLLRGALCLFEESLREKPLHLAMIKNKLVVVSVMAVADAARNNNDGGSWKFWLVPL